MNNLYIDSSLNLRYKAPGHYTTYLICGLIKYYNYFMVGECVRVSATTSRFADVFGMSK